MFYFNVLEKETVTVTVGRGLTRGREREIIMAAEVDAVTVAAIIAPIDTIVIATETETERGRERRSGRETG